MLVKGFQLPLFDVRVEKLAELVVSPRAHHNINPWSQLYTE